MSRTICSFLYAVVILVVGLAIRHLSAYPEVVRQTLTGISGLLALTVFAIGSITDRKPKA